MCLSNDILRKVVLSGINILDRLSVIHYWMRQRCDVGTFILSFMFPADWNKLGVDFLLYVARAYAG